MATHCYICVQSNRKKNDAYFVCNNCGGIFCSSHGKRDPQTKDSWCDDCVTSVAAASAVTTAAAVSAIAKLDDRLKSKEIDQSGLPSDDPDFEKSSEDLYVEPSTKLYLLRNALKSDQRIAEFFDGDLEKLVTFLWNLSEILKEHENVPL